MAVISTKGLLMRSATLSAIGFGSLILCNMASASPTFLVGNQNFVSLTRATVDGNTVSVESVGSQANRWIYGMALDASNNVWFSGGTDTGAVIGTLDPITGATLTQTPITNLTWGPIVGISFAPDGTLYAIRDDQSTETLGTLDTTTGAFTPVLHIGAANWAQDIAFVDNTLYAIDLNWGLTTIDTTTGIATDVNASVGGNGQRGMTYHDGVMYLTKHGLETVDLTTGVQTTIGTNAELGNLQGGIVAAPIPEPAAIGAIASVGMLALRRRSRHVAG